MPAERTVVRRTVSAVSAATLKNTKKVAQAVQIENVVRLEQKKPVAIDEDISTVHPYPLTAKERENAINRNTGRKITAFQFQVYDLCAQIPKGQISTYKHISEALQSSPRAVGQALKINPYAPLPVPCHRVLDSKLYIGGFSGQWGEGEKIDNKRAKLFHEGIVFDEMDYVVVAARENLIFDRFDVPNNKKTKTVAIV
ncbi:hypothetical protein BGZ51_002958 [Haplosporangium sp. Z 767]|nr:hypothetical protein BGZ51_002958 [Haplosporangium sp. Z 767]KAF9196887.1 hypothetical protein BGZ50_005962 [Haplosporangium sp. Z 11]